MKLQLIHTENYLVAVDDLKLDHQPIVFGQIKGIKVGDIVLEGYVDGTKGLEQIDTLNDIDVLLQKRITYHLPLNNAPVLEGIELLPPLEDDEVAKEAERDWIHKEHGFEEGDNPKRCVDGAIQKPKFINGYVKGYNKAKENERNKLTPFKNLIALIENGLLKGTIDIHNLLTDEIKVCKEYLQSLSQPNLPTSFDTETKQYIYATHN